MTRADSYRRADTALSARFADETVLVDHATGTVARLNGAASCVWEVLASACTPSEVAQVLTERFGIPPARAKLDGARAIEELQCLGFVVPFGG